MRPALLVIAAYLLGSIPFGYAAGRLARVDLRVTGSGNTGATNVYRSLGLWGAVPVILLDVLKGFLPVWLFPMWGRKGVAIPGDRLRNRGRGWTRLVRFPAPARRQGGVATAAGVSAGPGPDRGDNRDAGVGSASSSSPGSCPSHR